MIWSEPADTPAGWFEAFKLILTRGSTFDFIRGFFFFFFSLSALKTQRAAGFFSDADALDVLQPGAALFRLSEALGGSDIVSAAAPRQVDYTSTGSGCITDYSYTTQCFFVL